MALQTNIPLKIYVLNSLWSAQLFSESSLKLLEFKLEKSNKLEFIGKQFLILPGIY